jgi:hypothetical protein
MTPEPNETHCICGSNLMQEAMKTYRHGGNLIGFPQKEDDI